mgnify:CR=1 FL=1
MSEVRILSGTPTSGYGALPQKTLIFGGIVFRDKVPDENPFPARGVLDDQNPGLIPPGARPRGAGQAGMRRDIMGPIWTVGGWAERG